MVTFDVGARRHAVSRHGTAARGPIGILRSARPQIRRVLQTPQVQAKLTVGPPDDEFEQEADRVADQVMRMPDAALTSAGAPRIQRVCKECVEEDARLQRAPRGSSDTPAAPTSSTALESVIRSLGGNGQPLPDSARVFFEPRLGRDLSAVRIHTGKDADHVARAVQAKAFTVGPDVVFAGGSYAPESTEGRRLIAHELVHTVQQTPNTVRRIPLEPTGTPFEGEIIPWSAALRAAPNPNATTVADLPRGQRVTVLGGRAWIQLTTRLGARPLTGFVSHELIKQGAAATAAPVATTGAPPTAMPVPASAPVAAPGPLQFNYSAELDSELKARFNQMVIAFNEIGIKHDDKVGDFRTPQQAHIVSTAHNIRERDAIKPDILQSLKDGKDLDGNTWYQKDWDSAKAKANALALAQHEGTKYINAGKVSCAYEGYDKDDEHRRPNVTDVPVSAHTRGKAIDLGGIEWDELGGQWSAEAKLFVGRFGLTRPFTPDANAYCKDERWHFELAPGPAPEFGTFAQSYRRQVKAIGPGTTVNVTDPIDRTITRQTGIVWAQHGSGRAVLVLVAIENSSLTPGVTRILFLNFVDDDVREIALARAARSQPRGVQAFPWSAILLIPDEPTPSAATR